MNFILCQFQRIVFDQTLSRPAAAETRDSRIRKRTKNRTRVRELRRGSEKVLTKRVVAKISTCWAIEKMTEFTKSVRTYFDFLIHDFGFTLTSDDDGVRYDISPLYIGISEGKGETDVLFRIKIDTETIRPYVTHIFSLDQVVRYYKKGPFPTFASFPAVPGIGEDQRYLMYLSALTKKYCGNILRGDITAFERLSQNPGAKHA